jgi:hypothetical protein
MKFKKIVGFGDSWMWGDELVDPTADTTTHSGQQQQNQYREQNCFLGQLGQHYQAPTENFGIPGGSLQTATWNFLWWLEHEPNPEECLVIVENTYADRVSNFNANYKNISYYPAWSRYYVEGWNMPSEAHTMIKLQTVLSVCKELREINYTQAVLTFDGIAARRNFKLFQFNLIEPECPLTNVPTLIWPDWNLVDYFSSLQKEHGMKYYKPNLHPNELGHQLIAQRLINLIDQDQNI